MKLSAIFLLFSVVVSAGAYAQSDKVIRRACRDDDMFRNSRFIHRFDDFDDCFRAMRDCRFRERFCDNEDFFHQKIP